MMSEQRKTLCHSLAIGQLHELWSLGYVNGFATSRVCLLNELVRTCMKHHCHHTRALIGRTPVEVSQSGNG